MRPGGPAVVRRIDHLNVVVPDPRRLFGVLTERFELPVAWPFTRFPSFESGAAGLGINIEVVRYAPGRPSPVPENAGLYAIAFEPEALTQARAELARRNIPHSPPLRFTGRYPTDANTPVFHKRSSQPSGLWTLVILGGLIGDESSAERYSRGIERGDSRLAPLLGWIGGRLGSGRFAARFSSQREGGEDHIERMVWTVRSLGDAVDWLRRQGLFGEGRDGTVRIAPDALQGVNIWLEAEG